MLGSRLAYPLGLARLRRWAPAHSVVDLPTRSQNNAVAGAQS